MIHTFCYAKNNYVNPIYHEFIFDIVLYANKLFFAVYHILHYFRWKKIIIIGNVLFKLFRCVYIVVLYIYYIVVCILYII